jgi:hypothetical protein
MNIKSFFGFIFLTLSFITSALGQNPYDAIGVKHNEMIKYYLNNLPARPASGTFKQSLRTICEPAFPTEFSNYAIVPEFISYENSVANLRQNGTAEAYAKFVELETSLKSLTTVRSVHAYVAQKEATASVDVSASLLPNYLMALSIIKHSSKLWYTTENGGENGRSLIGFSPITGNGNGGGEVYAFKPWKLLSCDFLGALNGIAGGPAGGAVGVVVGSAGYAISEW